MEATRNSAAIGDTPATARSQLKRVASIVIEIPPWTPGSKRAYRDPGESSDLQKEQVTAVKKEKHARRNSRLADIDNSQQEAETAIVLQQQALTSADDMLSDRGWMHQPSDDEDRISTLCFFSATKLLPPPGDDDYWARGKPLSNNRAQSNTSSAPQDILPAEPPDSRLVSNGSSCLHNHGTTDLPPSPPISEENNSWADQVVRFDPKLNRLRYSHPDPAESFDDHHRVILEAAYNSYKGRIDRLKDEDYEFFAVITGVSPPMVESWFKERTLSKGHSIIHVPASAAVTPGSKDKREESSDLKSPIKEHSTMIKVFKTGDPEVVFRRHFPVGNRDLQDKSCLSIAKYGDIEKCKACKYRQANEPCVFSRFRYFYIDPQQDNINYDNQAVHGCDFFTDTDPDERYRFNKKDLEKEETFYIFAHIHTLARSIFEIEIQHVANALDEAQYKDGDDPEEQQQANKKPEDYVRRPSMDRQYCGTCKASTVGGYWMCCVCGEDLCTECYKTLCETTFCTKKRQHKKEQFVPCGKFHLSTLRDHLEALEQKAKLIPKYLRGRLEERFTFAVSKPMPGKVNMEYRKPIEFDVEQFTQEQFQKCWSRGDVVVVSRLQNRFQKDWSPRHLKVLQGDALVTACDIKTRATKIITLGRYFDLHFGNKAKMLAWKMQEWPSEPFRDVVRPLFDDLLRALPLPEYTRPDGVFNLSRYFPMRQVRTDLSPKLYASKGLGTKVKSYGSIPISSELSDAIYICVHTENSKEEGSDVEEEFGGTLSTSSKDKFAAVIWDIYREEDRHLVKEFLDNFIRDQLKIKRIVDPWTSHRFYLSPEQQLQLYQETGVRSYRVLQRKGEAVMIPAGCLRQARYIHDSILVGVDFVSPERFTSTWRWHEEWRILNLKRKNMRQLDVLMTKDILFYSTLAML